MKGESVCRFTDYQKAMNTVNKEYLWACFLTKENVEYYQKHVSKRMYESVVSEPVIIRNVLSVRQE